MLFRSGRDEAVKTQKLWIAKEKEVVGQVAEVEDALDAEIKLFDDNIERLANEEKERKESAYINRQATLTKMGATYVDGSFVLGAASFEANLVKGASDEVWESAIIPKFTEEYEKIEVVRIAEQKKKDDEAAELKRQQEELAQKQRDFEKQQAELVQQQQAAAQKEAERVAAEQAKINAENDRVFTERLSALKGWSFNGVSVINHGVLFGTKADLYSAPADVFNKIVEDNTLFIAESARKAEEQRLADIETAKQDAIKKEQERQAEQKRLDEIKAQQQEQQRLADLEAANDKTKWEDFLRQVKAISMVEMRSGQYRKRIQMAKEKIEEILNL